MAVPDPLAPLSHRISFAKRLIKGELFPIFPGLFGRGKIRPRTACRLMTTKRSLVANFRHARVRPTTVPDPTMSKPASPSG